MNGDIIRVDSYDFEERIFEGNTAVIFLHSEDSVSRAMKPIFEELAEEYYGKIRFLETDIEQSPDIAVRFGIEVLPTVAILKQGKLAEIITGANPPSVYADAIDEIC